MDGCDIKFEDQNDKSLLADCLTVLGAKDLVISLKDGSGKNAQPVELKAKEYVNYPKHIIRIAAREVRKRLNVANEMPEFHSKSKEKVEREPFMVELVKKIQISDSREEIFNAIEKMGWSIL
jgi:N6-adenosine-specific RNA methylase IME4